MKFKTILASLILCAVLTGRAQTTNTPANFFGQLANWATTANTGYGTFDTNLLSFDLGMVYVNNVNVAMRNTLEVNPIKAFHNAEAEVAFDVLGASTDINGAYAGIGYDIHYGDLVITPHADGGYSWLDKQPQAFIGIRAKKGLTKFTYAALDLFVGIDKNPKEGVTVSTGFTF